VALLVVNLQQPGRGADARHDHRPDCGDAGAGQLGQRRHRAELLETSRQLEAALHALPAAPQVTRASTALTIAELQDRILEVDFC
jgi:hypothetical protein